LPPGETDIENLLQRIDGLILSGGGDIDPALYGGLPHATIYDVNGARDQSEIRMAQYALKSHLPLLGICRGIQVMNVALGGTLIEHLPDIVGDHVQHKRHGQDVIDHTVTLLADSGIARILGQDTFNVPSCHHQAIRKLASPLKKTATSSDGIIEAVEIADDPSQEARPLRGSHPFFIGVQWHPELSTDPLQQKLFDRLIKTASRKQS
jgi:putative glutamine amidotransferase